MRSSIEDKLDIKQGRQKPVTSQFRLYKSKKENVTHRVSEYNTLAQKEYKKGRDNLGRIIH